MKRLLVTVWLIKHETGVFQYICLEDDYLILTVLRLPEAYTLHFTQSLSNVLEILGTYLHPGPLDRIAILLPVIPVHSFTIDLAIKVQTIQIGVVTTVVPPSAFMTQDTVTTVLVTIAILGRK